MNTPLVPHEIRHMALRFRRAGWKAYLVGGAVRDALLGRASQDFDLATDARPEDVIALFPRVIPTGLQHGTVTVVLRAHHVEVTTFRIEHGYSDSRHPDRVEFASDIEADLSRRDFTVNAMAWNILDAQLVDPFGGQADLKARLIRAVGNPQSRFEEDGLRPLRAIRFAAQLGFSIETHTRKAIPEALPQYRMVSAERVREEFSKIMTSAQPSVGLRLMEATGFLFETLPEFCACRSMAQKGGHRFDVLDHLYSATDAAPPELILRLASFFHDVGKPESRRMQSDDLEPTFYRHEEISARIAEAALKRLRYPNALVDRVRHLVAAHMFNYDHTWTDAAIRRFVARVGVDAIEPLLALRLADAAGKTGLPPDPGFLDEFRQRLQQVLNAGSALSLKGLAVHGADLASIGIPSGPAMGYILKELLETVLADPARNERQTLLHIAAQIWDTKRPHSLGL